MLKTMTTQLDQLKAKGQTPRPERQVGAWQTSEVTPYAKTKAVQQIAMSRVRPISLQEQELLEEATKLVQVFQKTTQQFMKSDWESFVQEMRQMNIDWLEELDEGF